MTVATLLSHSVMAAPGMNIHVFVFYVLVGFALYSISPPHVGGAEDIEN